MSFDISQLDDLEYNSDSKLTIGEYYESDSPEPELSCSEQLSRLFKSVSICNILQSHSKILVLDSRLPMTTCLRSLSNYHRDFAFVYDVDKTFISGHIDELSIVKFLRNFDTYLNMNCSQFLDNVNPGMIHRQQDDISAYEGFEFSIRNKLNRVFVWSNDRKAPIGYLTPSCYLLYFIKNLRGNHELMELPLKSVTVKQTLTKLPDVTTLDKALDFLILNDNILLVDSRDNVTGLLTRRKVCFFAMDLLRNELPLHYKSTVLEVVKYIETKYNKHQNFYVVDTLSIKDAICGMLLRSDRALAYTNKEGNCVIVSVWDMISFIVDK